MRKATLALTLVLLVISVASAASLGASLTVPPLVNTTLKTSYTPENPRVNQEVMFIADYEDENGTDIVDANVTISVDGKTYQMAYSPSNSAFIFKKKFDTTGVYFTKITAKKVGYVEQIKEFGVRISFKSMSSGGGNSFIVIKVGNQSMNILPVPPNTNLTIGLDILENFQKLTIYTSQQISSGTINIQRCNKDYSLSSGIVFDCLSVDLEDIYKEQYENAVIHFKIPKEWINSNNINDSKIGIIEISNGVNRIIPYRISEDEGNVYFYFKTMGFSEFIIYGEKNNATSSEPPKVIFFPNEIMESQQLSICCWMLVVVGISLFMYYLTKEEIIPLEEKRKAKQKLTRLKAKLNGLYSKSNDIESKLKKMKTRKGKNFGAKLNELKKVHEKIEDIKNEIADLEQKYKLR
ncbi:MAG: PGF-pre-PGF domain-containing protein [Nanoarchaeota archaeon]|nr:PGF-pre-PGF domain-containing protein [Nanoarchaeota archaeon]